MVNSRIFVSKQRKESFEECEKTSRQEQQNHIKTNVITLHQELTLSYIFTLYFSSSEKKWEKIKIKINIETSAKIKMKFYENGIRANSKSN